MQWGTRRSSPVVRYAGSLVLKHLAAKAGNLRARGGSVYEDDSFLYIGRGSSTATERDRHWSNAYWNQHVRFHDEAQLDAKSLVYLLLTATPDLTVCYWLIPSKVVAAVFKLGAKDRPGATQTLHILKRDDVEVLGEQEVTSYRTDLVLTPEQMRQLQAEFEQEREEQEAPDLSRWIGGNAGAVASGGSAATQSRVSVEAPENSAGAADLHRAVASACRRLIEAGTPARMRMRDEVMLVVEGTRVPVDTVVEEFRRGSTPEETIQRYPTLELVDVYELVGVYLREIAAFHDYLDARQRLREALRRQAPAGMDEAGLRERLLARKRG